MVVTRYPAEAHSDARQQETRAEWRRLCFVLEGIQATHLIERCGDKFTFARTYAAYLADETRSLAALMSAIGRGDYGFFLDRGVPPSLMCESFALQLLRDWNAAIVSKQTRLAEAFEGRFGEDIDVFSATPKNGGAIAESSAVDEGNAVWLLDRWAPHRARAA